VIKIDLTKMVEINTKLYTSTAQAVFDNLGTTALRNLLSSITQIYARHDPGLRKDPLALFADATLQPSKLPGAIRATVAISRVTHELDGPTIARVRADGALEVSSLDLAALTELSKTAVVYLFDSNGERFIIGGKVHLLDNPVVGYPSMFSKPTFGSLKEALEDYRLKAAAQTSCLVLKDVWNDEKRWWFRTKPEATMRRSLTQFLRNVLRDANVRPEQNVDESHPVDIHVGFAMTQLHAIIEIKWLGKSMDANGDEATPYAQGRAHEGAKQLAEYLDKSHEWAPSYTTRGYLVVYDGRRSGLKKGIKQLDHENALNYEKEDIFYDPVYTGRKDFEAPVRMFMYPNLA
jgi:hypothetical protein